jgi:transposase
MAIVGGLDIHRKQVTFDYVDTETGQLVRGQIAPADRVQLRSWLTRFAGHDRVAFGLEGCTGWRYVAEELAAAGCQAYVGEPADTAALRGRKRRAKTDRTDSRHIRELVDSGRLPLCWIPPWRVLECRALLQAYHDLRVAHTGWVQRVHAVLFHQGAPALGRGGLSSAAGLERLGQISAEQLSPAGQMQVAVALRMLDVHQEQLAGLRRQLLAAAGRMRGARVLAETLYGVGPVTALALVCWLGGAGRFRSSRQAVRFAGLDVSVYSSAGKSSPGRLSRQGPAVLRWCVYEAGKTHARASAPDHAYYARVKERIDGKRAAISEARKIIRRAVHLLAELGDTAFDWAPTPTRARVA